MDLGCPLSERKALMVALIYSGAVKTGKIKPIWTPQRNALLQTDPLWASCHTPQVPSLLPYTSCGAGFQCLYTSLSSQLSSLINIHHTIALFREKRQAMYALSGLPKLGEGNIDIKFYHNTLWFCENIYYFYFR